ncbi:hypothetical protein AS156_16550 [Bradyrhizobium macuxiense]|uniref:Uncharacterized protein n=1 Tax=Bradyrhizobium macuxiense TaxID=1755647 RepID=A0A109JHR6_9BRAD|nr:hypothetical protein [Bradyrhizobium macuxiense]KWV49075.1 hypothetical protein AS156_16550 [Bradyrhizobium macuxiense]
MTEATVRIRSRFYVIDFERGTYHRARPRADVGNYPGHYREAAAELLTCSYWRDDMTEAQNAAAHAFADGGTSGDNIRVIITGLRILKERSYLKAVADGDDELVAELDAHDRAIG